MSKDALNEKWGIHSSDSTEDKPKQAANQNAAPKSEFFGVDLNSHFVPSIKFQKRDGKLLFLPYSSQPIIEFNPDTGILVRSFQKIISIKGRGLVKLAEWLGSQKVVWVAESTTGTDDESEDIFISAISVEDVS